MPPKSFTVRIGDFLFKYRNRLFPFILAGLFLSFKPADTYIGNHAWVELKDWVAIAITTSGLLLRAAVIGFAYIKRGGLRKQVYAETLVTEGFFGVCRNPLYVGNMLIYSGVFLMHGNPAVMVLGTLSYFFIYQCIIAAEEYFLHGKFGEAYTHYCHDVPRWGLKLGRLKQATEGMGFNIKRVIIKDYPTIANAVIALILVKLLGTWHFSSTETFLETLYYSGLLITAVLMFMGIIALAKKRRFLKL